MINDLQYDIVYEQGIELIKFYRENPCIAAFDLLRADLATPQRLVFEDMWFKDHVLVVAGRGCGKSYMLGLFAALTGLLYPGKRVGIIAPSFRQSKIIFNEIEKLYSASPIFREACEKKPTRGTDSCYVKFKSVGGIPFSYAECLPLSDGSKIRGSRFHVIVLDELPHIPAKIIDMVIRPMAATTSNPMERVRYLERKERLLREGLANEDDFEEASVNKMIMTSSGYYKFNHMWKRMKDYWKQMDLAKQENRPSKYAVWQIPYTDMPKGFLDENNIKEAKRVMSSHEFSMEYEANMVSDSDGFYKASLLEECTNISDFDLELRGTSDASYVLGVDPNQGGSGSDCGFIVVKLGKPNKIVNLIVAKGKTTQDITSIVQRMCSDYNIIRVFMDRGGGGKAVMDLLEEGYGDQVPILDRSNKDNLRKEGRHILDLIQFNPKWSEEANYSALALLESREILFPRIPANYSKDNEDINSKIDNAYELVDELKRQILSIVVTQTGTGALHFDTPKKGQRKDLYSSFILACYGIRAIDRESGLETEPELYGASGFIKPRNSNSWKLLDSQEVKINNDIFNLAVLKKPIK